MATQTAGDRLREIFDAFNRGDADGALALIDAHYADDLVFKDPLQTLEGKPAFMAMNHKFFDKGQALTVELGEIVEQGEQLFMTWKMRFRPRFGPTVVCDGASHAKVRDGRFYYHRDYWDLLDTTFGSIPVAGPIYRSLVKRLG